LEFENKDLKEKVEVIDGENKCLKRILKCFMNQNFKDLSIL